MELSITEIKQYIYIIRGHQVVLDRDLAEFYKTKTKVLNQAVSRNLGRFPGDFMFQLTVSELRSLPSYASVDQSEDHGGTRKLPYAFTREGVSMLSGVLRSDKAIQINNEAAVRERRVPAFSGVRNFGNSRFEVGNLAIRKGHFAKIESILQAVAAYFKISVRDLNRVSRVPAATLSVPRSLPI